MTIVGFGQHLYILTYIRDSWLVIFLSADGVKVRVRVRVSESESMNRLAFSSKRVETGQCIWCMLNLVSVRVYYF
jgi:hypothetical protein